MKKLIISLWSLMPLLCFAQYGSGTGTYGSIGLGGGGGGQSYVITTNYSYTTLSLIPTGSGTGFGPIGITNALFYTNGVFTWTDNGMETRTGGWTNSSGFFLVDSSDLGSYFVITNTSNDLIGPTYYFDNSSLIGTYGASGGSGVLTISSNLIASTITNYPVFTNVVFANSVPFTNTTAFPILVQASAVLVEAVVAGEAAIAEQVTGGTYPITNVVSFKTTSSVVATTITNAFPGVILGPNAVLVFTNWSTGSGNSGTVIPLGQYTTLGSGSTTINGGGGGGSSVTNNFLGQGLQAGNGAGLTNLPPSAIAGYSFVTNAVMAGADPTGNSDCTAVVQSLIDKWWNGGSPASTGIEIDFPSGRYLWNRTPTNSFTSAGLGITYGSMLSIPYASPNLPYVHFIKFHGLAPCPPFAGSLSLFPSTNGVDFVTTSLTTNWWLASSDSNFTDFNCIEPMIDNICWIEPTNSAMSFLYLYDFNFCEVKNTIATVTDLGSLLVSNSMCLNYGLGLILPKVNNGGFIVVDNFSAQGLGTGLLISEHLEGGLLNFADCINGMMVAPCNHMDNLITHCITQNCYRSVIFNHLFPYNLQDDGSLSVTMLDIEHTAWFATPNPNYLATNWVQDVYDNSMANGLFGTISYYVMTDNVINTNLTVAGTTNLHLSKAN